MNTYKNSRIFRLFSNIGHGLLISIVIAISAQFLSDHYGAPAMLMALLLGMALNFLAQEGKCVAGIEFSSKTILRIGVALLGIRISADLLIELGPGMIVFIFISVVLTIVIGLLGAKFLKRGWRLALLTGGSVAICGVSAAIAISAILPKNNHTERNLLFTVVGVTVLSTLAMIFYPMISKVFEMDHVTHGIFLGATIHDVAQVIGAGFTVSRETGDTATVVKLLRVSMLAPVILILSLIVGKFYQATEVRKSKRPAMIPGFILGFLFLAACNSLQLIPQSVSELVSSISGWALLTSIAAVGMKSSLHRIKEVGGQAIILIVAETLFLATFVLIWIHYLL